MTRPRRNLRRFRVMVLTVLGGVQVPAVAAVAHFTGSWWIALAGAIAISAPYAAGLRNPFDDAPKSRLYLYGALWPFFAWWVGCLVFAVLAPIALAVAWVLHLPVDPALATAGAVALLLGVDATRRTPRIVANEVRIAGLPAALDGYRIAQISDIHCGSFTPAERVDRWVARMNALDVDLVAVTGDLITSGDQHVEAIARTLGGLRARDGVFACMGNHDYFTDGERLAGLLEEGGLVVLRNRGVVVARGDAQLYVAGVDDTWTGRDDVEAAMAARPDGAPTLLLAHDPNLFPQAAALDVELTLSGHTHGGQLAVPLFSRRLNLARIITRFTAGLYAQGRSALYVSRGAGTTGPPIRLGARAEIAVLTLRCGLEAE